jgi:hypothetical protein
VGAQNSIPRVASEKGEGPIRRQEEAQKSGAVAAAAPRLRTQPRKQGSARLPTPRCWLRRPQLPRPPPHCGARAPSAVAGEAAGWRCAS